MKTVVNNVFFLAVFIDWFLLTPDWPLNMSKHQRPIEHSLCQKSVFDLACGLCAVVCDVRIMTPPARYDLCQCTRLPAHHSFSATPSSSQFLSCQSFNNTTSNATLTWLTRKPVDVYYSPLHLLVQMVTGVCLDRISNAGHQGAPPSRCFITGRAGMNVLKL